MYKLILFFYGILMFGYSVESGRVSVKEQVSYVPPGNINQLDILSYNVWALPVWLPQTGIQPRFNRISQLLDNSNHEIICIQEAFKRKFRKKVMLKLANDYNTYSDYTCNETILGPIHRDCHGGLMTFSKYPILNEYFINFPTFNHMRKEEIIGHKGFLISIIQRNQGLVAIINTHLYAGVSQADESFRLAQIKFLQKHINSYQILKDIPLILLGDLNINHPDIQDKPKSEVYTYLVEEMGFADSAPDLQEGYFTIDKTRNRFSSDHNGKQKLDYCFYKAKNGYMIKVIEQEATFGGSQAYSDHLGWHTILELRTDQNAITYSD